MQSEINAKGVDARNTQPQCRSRQGPDARRMLPSTDFADDGVVHDAHAWSWASSSCWRPDRHTAGWRRQRTSGNAGGGRCCRAASAPRRPGRLRCGSACPRHPGSSMKWVGLVGELVTPRGPSRGRKLPSGRRHRERLGRLRWECRSTDAEVRRIHRYHPELISHRRPRWIWSGHRNSPDGPCVCARHM